MKHIYLLLILSFSINLNSFADIKTGNSQATASVNPACRIKVNNMSFGDVSMQSMAGNGDVYSTTELSLLCTKDQSATFTSNLGVNVTGTSSTWINGTNFICVRSNTLGGVYTDVNSNVCLSEHNNGSHLISSTPFRYAVNNLYYKSIRPDGSSITAGESPSYGKANLASGANKIPYSISTNNVTYAPINATASNPLIYSQNNGDWQAYNLYGKANVSLASPGNYTDTNTITVNF